jgi:hypothetical protein
MIIINKTLLRKLKIMVILMVITILIRLIRINVIIRIIINAFLIIKL